MQAEHGNDILVVANQNWRNGQKAAKKIVDDKIHSEDVLQ